MKNLFFAMLVLFLVMKTSSASATITCLDSQVDVANQKLESMLQAAVISAFKGKKIAVDPTKITMSIYGSVGDEDGTPYGFFGVSKGSAVSASGTSFLLDFSGDDNNGNDSQYLATYRPVLTNDGFDKEGNPIRPHCTLKLDRAFIANIAERFIVQNASSGKVIAQFGLPKTIVLY